MIAERESFILTGHVNLSLSSEVIQRLLSVTYLPMVGSTLHSELGISVTLACCKTVDLSSFEPIAIIIIPASGIEQEKAG